MSAFSKNKPEAVKFVRYLSSPEVSKMQAVMASHLPVFPSVYKDADVLKANPWFAEALPVVEGAKSRPVSHQYPQVSDVIRSNMNAYLAGTKTTDTALADMKSSCNQSCGDRHVRDRPREGGDASVFDDDTGMPACAGTTRTGDEHRPRIERRPGRLRPSSAICPSARSAALLLAPAALLLLRDRRLSDRRRCSGTACTVSTTRTLPRASSGSGSRTTPTRSRTTGSGARRWHTIGYILVTVPVSLVVGLGLALLANMPFRVKWPVRLGLLLPWALPLVFAGLIFRWFFEYKTGVVNDVLMTFGVEPFQWLSDPTLAFIAICIAIVWKSSSFMALMLLAGLQTIPRSLYEAAEVDGATKWQQFTQITLPMLRPAIFVALIFRTITAIQTFDIPFAMTGGGPGDSTETLAMYIHKTTLDFLDFGYGSALAALMFVLSMVATSGYLRYTRTRPGEDDRCEG